MGIFPGWARPCTLRTLTDASNSTYSPFPLNEKLVPSKVTKWGSPKAEAEAKAEDQIDLFDLSHPGVTPPSVVKYPGQHLPRRGGL